LAQALLLVEKAGLSYSQRNELSLAGMSHIVAVSGMHLSILFALVYALTLRQRVLSALLGIPVAFFFAAVAGFTPSVTRAAVMLSLSLLARLCRREYDPPSALAFAVLVLLLGNPLTAASASFQLSVGAVAGGWAGAAAATARVKADLRATKKEMERLTLTMKHAATYRQLRPLYEEYRQSRDKEKFLRGHEGEIILFEAAARELKRLDAVPLPATKRLRAEMDGLTARRTALQSEYRKAQREEREYDTLRQNVEALLEKPREAEPQRQRNHELE